MVHEVVNLAQVVIGIGSVKLYYAASEHMVIREDNAEVKSNTKEGE